MIVSSNVKMSDGVKNRQNEVMEAIRKKADIRRLYCITLPSNSRNLLDIYPYREVLKRNKKGVRFHILGLAAGRKEAAELVREMASLVASDMECAKDFHRDFLKYRDSFFPEEERPGI